MEKTSNSYLRQSRTRRRSKTQSPPRWMGVYLKWMVVKRNVRQEEKEKKKNQKRRKNKRKTKKRRKTKRRKTKRRKK